MRIRNAQQMVRAFHERFELPPFDGADDGVNWHRHKARAGWIKDECRELEDGYYAENEAEVADAYIDILYFALGGLVEMGIQAEPLLEAVHAANMSKIKLPGVAKIAKPEGWKHPDIAALIAAQRKSK